MRSMLGKWLELQAGRISLDLQRAKGSTPNSQTGLLRWFNRDIGKCSRVHTSIELADETGRIALHQGPRKIPRKLRRNRCLNRSCVRNICGNPRMILVNTLIGAAFGGATPAIIGALCFVVALLLAALVLIAAIATVIGFGWLIATLISYLRGTK